MITVMKLEKSYLICRFKYGKHRFRGDNIGPVSVTLEKQGEGYVFHRVTRKDR